MYHQISLCIFLISDENDDNLDFLKILKVQTYDQLVQAVPIKSAIRIPEEQSKRMVREIIRKQIDTADENIDRLEESKLQLFRTKSYDRVLLNGNPVNNVDDGKTRDFLKEKIGKKKCFFLLFYTPLACISIIQDSVKLRFFRLFYNGISQETLFPKRGSIEVRSFSYITATDCKLIADMAYKGNQTLMTRSTLLSLYNY